MNNAGKKVVFYSIITFIVFTVIIPMLYLTTLSFSSSIEVSDYPKQMIPSFSHDLRVEWDEENLYYKLARLDNSGEYEELYFGSKFNRIEKYISTYLNVSKSVDEIENDFSVSKETGETVYLKYNKNIFIP